VTNITCDELVVFECARVSIAVFPSQLTLTIPPVILVLTCIDAAIRTGERPLPMLLPLLEGANIFPSKAFLIGALPIHSVADPLAPVPTPITPPIVAVALFLVEGKRADIFGACLEGKGSFAVALSVFVLTRVGGLIGPSLGALTMHNAILEGADIFVLRRPEVGTTDAEVLFFLFAGELGPVSPRFCLWFVALAC